jgi:hypothetical protein
MDWQAESRQESQLNKQGDNRPEGVNRQGGDTQGGDIQGGDMQGGDIQEGVSSQEVEKQYCSSCYQLRPQSLLGLWINNCTPSHSQDSRSRGFEPIEASGLPYLWSRKC